LGGVGHGAPERAVVGHGCHESHGKTCTELEVKELPLSPPSHSCAPGARDSDERKR
jgi:hypothetical protein